MEDNTNQYSSSGRIWFVCFLPLIGLFLQNYAVSAAAGAFLWAGVVISGVLCCLADARSLQRQEVPYSRELNKWAALTPVYVYKREKLLGRERYKALMLAAFVFAALTMNGFTKGLALDNDSMPVMTQRSYVQDLDNFSGSSPDMIGDVIEDYLGKEANWHCTHKGDVYTVTVSGEHDGEDMEILFTLEHDGFVYKAFYVSDILKNGKSVKKDEQAYKDLMMEIFLHESSADEDSSQG
ncbi:MAG: hypothetical protein IJ129_01805 [Ruminococcus sp.]|nr:hypothetical protein [Ruminococcus sp.]